MKINTILGFAVLAAVLLLAGCQSRMTPDDLARSQDQLSEKERLFSLAVLSSFDLKQPGKVTVALEGNPASAPLLRFLNASSPKLRFGNLGKGVTFESVFNLDELDYFQPGYAYLHINHRSTLNGKGNSYGLILRQKETRWMLVDTYTLDAAQALDLKGYVRKHIEANQPPQPTPTSRAD